MRTMMAVFAVVVLLSGTLAAGEAPQTASQKGVAAYTAANKLRAEKKFAEALATYLQMAQDYPKHQLARTSLRSAAIIAKKLKKYEQSAEIHERMLKEFPNTFYVPATLYELGNLYYGRLRDYAKAAKYFKRAATEFPGYTNAESAYIQTMYCYRNTKDYPAMIALADRFMDSMSQKGTCALQMLSLKATAQIAQGDIDAMEKTVEQVAALAPQDRQAAAAYYRLGSQFSRKKEPKRAAEYYLKAAGISSYERAAACILTAADILRASSPEESIKLYRRYQKEYPKGDKVHDCYTRMGMVYEQYIKDPEKEIAVYEEFLQKHKKSIFRDRILWNLGRAAVRAKKPLRAISAYEMILNECPDSDLVPAAMYGLGIAHRGQGDSAKAREYFEKLIELCPANSLADSSASALKTLK